MGKVSGVTPQNVHNYKSSVRYCKDIREPEWVALEGMLL